MRFSAWWLAARQLGRCDGDASFRAFMGEADDLIRNIYGVAPVAELDGDDVGFLIGRVCLNQAAAVTRC